MERLVKIAERKFMLSMSREVIEKSRKFDLYIAPIELKNYKILDTVKAAEVFNIGYNSTREKLKDSSVLNKFAKIKNRNNNL